MKGIQSAVIVLIGLLSMAGMSHAQEYDFTFEVPVHVQDLLPDVTYISILVVVGTGEDVYRNPIGDGSFRIDIDPNAGSYRGTDLVQFNAYQDKDPSHASHYEVRVRLNGAFPVSFDWVGVRENWRIMKDGAQNNVVVTGTIPQ